MIGSWSQWRWTVQPILGPTETVRVSWIGELTGDRGRRLEQQFQLEHLINRRLFRLRVTGTSHSATEWNRTNRKADVKNPNQVNSWRLQCINQKSFPPSTLHFFPDFFLCPWTCIVFFNLIRTWDRSDLTRSSNAVPFCFRKDVGVEKGFFFTRVCSNFLVLNDPWCRDHFFFRLIISSLLVRFFARARMSCDDNKTFLPFRPSPLPSINGWVGTNEKGKFLVPRLGLLSPFFFKLSCIFLRMENHRTKQKIKKKRKSR